MKIRAFCITLALVMSLAITPAGAANGITAAVGTYQTFATGSWHNLAIKTDGSLWAWGGNASGQLGDATTVDKDEPVEIMDGVVSVAAGEHFSCAIKNDGSLWTWGDNSTGQLGDGTRKNKHTPIKIMDDVSFVSAGSQRAFAIKTDGSLWAWGYNNDGCLGDGTTEAKLSPIKLMDDVSCVVTAKEWYIEPEFDCAFAIKTDGTLWAWGENSNGRLGDGTRENKLVPVKITDGVISVSSRYDHTLAIKTDGSLWAWGRNGVGQLGDGTNEAKYTPIKIMAEVSSATAGDCSSYAIKTDGTLWGWGSYYVSSGSVLKPEKLLDDVAAVSTGAEHALAIKTDGTLWAWGGNTFRELGDGTYQKRYRPVEVFDEVVYTAAQNWESIAVKEDGSLWGWGLFYGHTPVEILDSLKLPESRPAPDPGPPPERPSFWADEQVASAIAAGLVPQSLQSQYTEHITRAEFCALAVTFCETVTGKEITNRKSFSDTEDVNVEKAAAAGIVSGIGGGKFDPDGKITREQAAVMLAQLSRAVGKHLSEIPPAFSDNDKIATWAFIQVGQIQGAGIMSGVGGNAFAPKERYTREQSIVTIWKLYGSCTTA